MTSTSLPGAFEERLAGVSHRPLLLDGATGTLLEARLRVRFKAPVWASFVVAEDERRFHDVVTSTDGRPPNVGLMQTGRSALYDIHRAYFLAGAELLTANTFGLHHCKVRSAGLRDEPEAMIQTAVDIARDAGEDRAWVAGSMSPVGDCYSPRAPLLSASALEREHRLTADSLKNAGVDAILVETQNSMAEALIAVAAAARTELPVLVSFITTRSGRLLSGDDLVIAAHRAHDMGASAVLVNCTSTRFTNQILRTLIPCRRVPIGAYANTADRNDGDTFDEPHADDPTVYAHYAYSWRRSGARIIGGCCGTTPGHIAALRGRLAASIW